MKSILQCTIVLLLALAPAMIASAFSPARAFGNQVAVARLNMSLGMGGKPAKSAEEDLDLTRAIILKHISAMDDSVDDSVDDDDGGDDESGGSSDSSDYLMSLSSSTSEKIKKPLKKAKSVGKKIKNKLKKKLSKEE